MHCIMFDFDVQWKYRVITGLVHFAQAKTNFFYHKYLQWFFIKKQIFTMAKFVLQFGKSNALSLDNCSLQLQLI